MPALLERAAADRQVVVGAVVVIGLARLVDLPWAWAVAVLVGIGTLLGAGWQRVSAGGADALPEDDVAPALRLTRPEFRGRWESVVAGSSGLESGIVPGVMAAALALAIQLVPLDWWLVVGLGVSAVLLDRTIAVERDVAVSQDPADDRWKVLLASLAAGFIGFAGIAALVPGGLAGVGDAILSEPDLVLLAVADAIVAVPLGFRLARLGPASRREAVISALGYGAVVAIAAGLLRAMAIPQLLAPALLTLLFYLWDALNATTPSIRRDPRWRWQVGLLLVLSAVVIAWNLRLRA
jgi:hypothetical protein